MTGTEVVSTLSSLNGFRLHTGNINAYSELKTKKFSNSAEELRACLQLQLNRKPQSMSMGADHTLNLCDSAHLSNYERGDLKITIKVFLSSWEPSEVPEAVKCLREQLKTDDLELLIISFPELDVIADESDEDEHARWLRLAEPIYRAVEDLVEKSEVVSIGVSDLSLDQLRLLWNVVDVKPIVNHLRLDGCCAVPPEMQAYARENDIQLLTHNDPHPFPNSLVYEPFCNENGCAQISQTPVTWTARYTVWLRRRSVMAAKGYITQFKKITADA